MNEDGYDNNGLGGVADKSARAVAASPSSPQAVSPVPASIANAGWTAVDPHNPPALHMVAIYSDGSGAVTLTKFDNSAFLMSEDAFEMGETEVAKSFSWWAPAPEGFVPHFMEVTPDDWY